ncbi:hypothetical protein SAMN05421505_12250 [Sinosporangium album]|uniref:Uncharacterized protein n=1 Tax=Sinosporangium album TaxID=504805 RepID=A0A1G8F4L1_9ACTN|nr:hypothetical protein [Sinosporangium album]SDH77071.1 hypothetical protein SAMN05421505_12250 [Sinosporangium album]
MLKISEFSVGYTIAETRQLFIEHGITIPTTALRFTAVEAVRTYLNSGRLSGVERINLSEQPSDPFLTGWIGRNCTTCLHWLRRRASIAA